MARIRSINPAAPHDQDVAEMSPWARITWDYLPCHADREGRLRDNPFGLKLEILPLDNVDMDAVLQELADRRHIIRYVGIDGRRYIQIRSFLRHQNPHKNEAPSKIPALGGRTEADIIESLREDSGATPAFGRRAPADPSPDPSPDDLSLSACDPSATEQISASSAAPQWDANRWKDRYGMAWCERYGQVHYGMASDTKGIVALGDLLGPMPSGDRARAQARAQRMFTEFLAGGSHAEVKARHPFAFFVQAFGGLLVDATALPATSARGSPRRDPLEDLPDLTPMPRGKPPNDHTDASRKPTLQPRR